MLFDALVSPWRAYIQHLIILALFLYALRRGAGPEKGAASILLATVVFDYLYHLAFPRGGLVYDTINYGHLVNDGLALVAFGILATKANRMYPLWMLGAQLTIVLMHFHRGISPAIEPISYLIMTRLPTYLQLVALMLGLIAHRRRVDRFVTYPSWRRS